jgi:hypothetical protein
MMPYWSPYTLYCMYAAELVRLTGSIVPFWHELDSEEQAYWESEAARLNAKEDNDA